MLDLPSKELFTIPLTVPRNEYEDEGVEIIQSQLLHTPQGRSMLLVSSDSDMTVFSPHGKTLRGVWVTFIPLGLISLC